MQLPKKIDPCPIVDSVVEIRFKSNTYPNAVFGLIYNALKEYYPRVEKLPILQLPEQLRDTDPNFKFKAHYKVLSTDNYSVQIGPEVLVIGAPSSYPGWQDFSRRIYSIIDNIIQSGIIQSITRLGIRFINFFEDDIFHNVNLEIRMNGDRMNLRNTVLRTEVEKNSFFNTLQIANNATNTANNRSISGSIIDIDTFKNYSSDISFEGIYQDEIETAHNTEKEIFFELLKEEFLNKLNPTYT